MYGLGNRTTGAVEAHNGVMGRNLPKRGGFFTTVRSLRMQEEKKFMDIQTIIRSGGGEGSKLKLNSKVSSITLLISKIVYIVPFRIKLNLRFMHFN